MKTAFLGDIHLRASETLGKRNSEGVSTLLQDKLDCITEFVNYVRDKDIDEVVLLGDIFHSMNPSEWLRERFWESLSPIIGEVPIRFILGNHDLSIKSVNLFGDISRLGKANRIAYDKSTVAIPTDGIQVLYAPYKFKLGEEKFHEHCPVLITHNGIEGGKVGFYDRPLDDPTYTQLDLRKFTVIISGHYHKPQEFEFGETLVIYVGSTTPIDFAERGEVKRFLTFNFQTFEWESIPFTPRREFLQIEVHQDQDPFDLLREIEKERYKDAVVKIKFTGDSVWYESINHTNLTELLYDELGVIDYVPEKAITNLVASTPYDIEDSMSNVQVIEEYSKKEELDTKIIEIGRKIFSEAQQLNET